MQMCMSVNVVCFICHSRDVDVHKNSHITKSLPFKLGHICIMILFICLYNLCVCVVFKMFIFSDLKYST